MTSVELTPEIIARVDAWIVAHRDLPEWGRQASMSTSRRWLLLGALIGELAKLRLWPDDPVADASAKGILLALVREAWGDLGMHTSAGTLMRPGDRSTWTTWSGDRMEGRLGETEAEALVAALEAAP
jgi:hypothetical protein